MAGMMMEIWTRAPDKAGQTRAAYKQHGRLSGDFSGKISPKVVQHSRHQILNYTRLLQMYLFNPEYFTKELRGIFQTPNMYCGISEMGQRRILKLQLSGHFCKKWLSITNKHLPTRLLCQMRCHLRCTARPLVKYECKLTATKLFNLSAVWLHLTLKTSQMPVYWKICQRKWICNILQWFSIFALFLPPI